MADKPQQYVTARDFDSKTYKVAVSDLHWRPGAYGIVIKDGCVLLLKQTNGYDLPGGGIEFGESAEEAVLREIQEESGVIAANPRLIEARTTYFRFRRNQQFYQALCLYFVCVYESGELSTDGFDEWEKINAIAPEWLPLDKLPDIKIGTTTDFRPFIEQAATNR